MLKSGRTLALSLEFEEALTLSVEEVLNRNIKASIGMNRGVSEDILGLGIEELLAVLVTKSSNMFLNRGRGKLLVERNLLKLHVVDTSGS